MSAFQGSPALAQDPEKAFEQAVKDRLSFLTISELTGAWMGCDIGLAQWPYLPMAFRLREANGRTPDWDAVISKLVNTTWTPDVILKLIGHESAGFSVARHPSTPDAVQESVLEALARDPDEWTRRSVAENPATPVAVLELLAKDPDNFVRSRVAANPYTPLAVLDALAKDKDHWVLFGVAGNPSTPVDVLDALAQDKDSGVRSSVAMNPSAHLVILTALANDKDSDVRSSVAKNLSIHVSILEALARDTDSDVRRSVLKRPSMPVTVLEALAQDKNSDVRSDVAEHPYTPGAVLEALANDRDRNVRRNVAKHPSAPVAVLEVLAKDMDGWVRSSVAENPSTPVAVREEVLEELAKDPSTWTRRSAAENPSAPVLVLEALAKDKDSDVRSSVARNPSTPVPVLEVLAKDKDSGVRNCIAKNPQTPPGLLEKLATDKDAKVFLGVAGNPNAPLPALLRLYESKADGVRKALAGQAHRSAQICLTLRKDPSEDVRLAVLRNTELDQATLDELAVGIEWEKDALAMLEHPNLSARSAQVIADKLFTALPTDSPWYRHQLSIASAEVQAAVKGNVVLSYPGKDPNQAVLKKRPLASLMALCAGPFIEPSRIVKVAGSTDCLVRAAVARNTGTPPNLLEKLSLDTHPLVSALVAVRYADEAKAMSNSGVSDVNSGTFDLNRVVQEILRRMRADGLGWACVPLVNSKAWRDQVNTHEFLSWLKRFEEFDEVVSRLVGELDKSLRDFFWQLAMKSSDGEVRMLLAKNNAVPAETLEHFLLGESVDALLVIANKVDVPKDLQLKAEKAAIRLIAKKGRSYRGMIAINHAYLTVAMRDRLAKDKDPWVQGELCRAQNLHYPEWMTQQEGLRCGDELSQIELGDLDTKLEVECGSVREVRRRQISDWLDQLRTVFQRELQIHQGSYVFTTDQITAVDVSNALMWLGYVPASDKVAPSKSARSTDWLTRFGAALHPGATQGILKLLREDVDPDVAQAARLRENNL